MKILDFIRGLFKSRDKPKDSYYFGTPFLFGRSISGLYPLMADRTTVKRDDDGKLVYTYRPTTGENEHMRKSAEITLRREDVLHIPALGFDGINGYSPIAMARNAIGVAMACEEFGAKFFENGARPSGILKVPHVLKDPQKLAESWQAAYGGVDIQHAESLYLVRKDRFFRRNCRYIHPVSFNYRVA